MSFIKKLFFTCILLGATAAPAVNTNDYQYVITYNNIHSLNPSISDEEYQNILSQPVYYNIQADTPAYKDTPFQKNKRYTRLHTTYIDEGRQIFYGKTEYDTIIQNRPTHITAYNYFILDKNQRKIQGGEVAPRHYTANFVGMDQRASQWPLLDKYKEDKK